MARIPDSELERLKSEVSVARLIEAGGVTLTKRGHDLVGACPFHKDDTPSLTITPDKNLFHCFGCGIGGGPLDWVMRKNGVSFRHAVELLREGLPGVTDATVKHSTVRALPPPVSLDADDHALLDQVVGYYHQSLKQSPEALAYLEARGLTHPELIDTFKLGYANRTLGLRLPNKQRKDGADIRARLERIGVYRESGHEHFNGSLVMPVLDERGHATEIYGRKIRDDLRPGTPKHLYLPGPHKGVWNIAGVAAAQGEVILTEALIDAATFWVAGYRNVTAAYGVEGFTADHLAAFKTHGIKRVLIAFDRDDAGERGAAKIADQLMAAGFDCYRILFPKGMDANAYGLKLTPASKSLGLLIRKAEWLGKGNPPCVPTTHLHPGASSLVTALPSRDPETLHPGALPNVASADPLPLPLAADPVQPVAAHDGAPRDPESVHPGASAFAHCALSDKSEISDAPVSDTRQAVHPGALAASVMPAAITPEPDASVNGSDVTIMLGERRYRVRGMAKNLAVDVMKVNLLAASGDAFHVDTFDLYSARHRANFIQMAAGELRQSPETIKSDLGKVLLKLEAMQDERIRETLKPAPSTREIGVGEREMALAYLRAPDLLARIVRDFETYGLVGETTNKLVAYLACVSRKLSSPLAVLVQSSSAAGKSSLMDAVLAFVPEEDRVRYSALTGQALFYMGTTSLKHRILAICEEEGAARAAYALKLLQSDGELTIASTAKDNDTGNLVTQEYRVEGPVMLFLTTTAIDIDEELMNRCLVLSVDEGRAQTEAIHRLQRRKRTLQGLMAREARENLVTLHRNVQRLLRSLAVVNPYADKLSFLSDRTRTRRDHEKYLTLIDAITLLHQHQRTIRTLGEGERATEYVEVTLADIEAANRIAHDVLGRSLDELPSQTRELLRSVTAVVEEKAQAETVARSEIRFTRRELRERSAMSHTQLGVHLTRLVELEYLVAHRGGRGQSFVYELLYDGAGDDDGAHLSGLIDVAALSPTITTPELRGTRGEFTGSIRPQNGAIPGGRRRAQNPETLDAATASEQIDASGAETHVSENKKPSASYSNGSSYTRAESSSLAASPLAADR